MVLSTDPDHPAAAASQFKHAMPKKPSSSRPAAPNRPWQSSANSSPRSLGCAITPHERLSLRSLAYQRSPSPNGRSIKANESPWPNSTALTPPPPAAPGNPLCVRKVVARTRAALAYAWWSWRNRVAELPSRSRVTAPGQQPSCQDGRSSDPDWPCARLGKAAGVQRGWPDRVRRRAGRCHLADAAVPVLVVVPVGAIGDGFQGSALVAMDDGLVRQGMAPFGGRCTAEKMVGSVIAVVVVVSTVQPPRR